MKYLLVVLLVSLVQGYPARSKEPVSSQPDSSELKSLHEIYAGLFREMRPRPTREDYAQYYHDDAELIISGQTSVHGPRDISLNIIKHLKHSKVEEMNLVDVEFDQVLGYTQSVYRATLGEYQNMQIILGDQLIVWRLEAETGWKIARQIVTVVHQRGRYVEFKKSATFGSTDDVASAEGYESEETDAESSEESYDDEDYEDETNSYAAAKRSAVITRKRTLPDVNSFAKIYEQAQSSKRSATEYASAAYESEEESAAYESASASEEAADEYDSAAYASEEASAQYEPAAYESASASEEAADEYDSAAYASEEASAQYEPAAYESPSASEQAADEYDSAAYASDEASAEYEPAAYESASVSEEAADEYDSAAYKSDEVMAAEANAAEDYAEYDDVVKSADKRTLNQYTVPEAFKYHKEIDSSEERAQADDADEYHEEVVKQHYEHNNYDAYPEVMDNGFDGTKKILLDHVNELEERQEEDEKLTEQLVEKVDELKEDQMAVGEEIAQVKENVENLD